ncbi:hypothetical protein ACQUW5_14340 [Legionella sp. CNM-1927-20]|uniref:hypothetical protein n=1 Tax=Legionella sp. CNM-1927-20 TaxID=3422221 RepID=UPI00403AD48A
MLFVTLWRYRQVFYYELLSKLTLFSQQVSSYLTKIAQLDNALALDDCFYLMAWMSVVLILILLISFYPLQLNPKLTYRKGNL